VQVGPVQAGAVGAEDGHVVVVLAEEQGGRQTGRAVLDHDGAGHGGILLRGGVRRAPRQDSGRRASNTAGMGRLTAALLLTVTLVMGLVGAGPIGAADLHQRNHERKGERLALDTEGAPTERVSDVACVDGFADTGGGTGFECDGVDLLSFTPSEEMDASAGIGTAALGGGLSDIWGWVDPEINADGVHDEYVFFGKTDGTAFYRVTDPTDPVYLGDLPSRALAQLIWFDMKVYADHVYIVSESAPFGMQVFDLTRLRDVATPQVFDEDFFYPLNVSAHNIAINEESGRAYIVGGNIGLAVPDACLSGLHIVDLSTPAVPVFAGCHQTNEGPGTGLGLVDDGTLAPTAYIHDTHCVIYDGPDTDHTGREICFNSSEVHVSIVDVTDPLLPTQIAVMEYPQTGYTHQGWLTEDGRHFLMGDEGDETGFGTNTRTLVFDVADLDSASFAFEHVHETESIDHNMYVLDGLVYQSNYTSGLRVLDVTRLDEQRMDEVAFFDTYPAELGDEAVFAGTWSNYPYLPSGTIAVTGTEDGLFLLRLQDDVAPAGTAQDG
jgi:choice-of-anchor B domain-containing protein